MISRSAGNITRLIRCQPVFPVSAVLHKHKKYCRYIEIIKFHLAVGQMKILRTPDTEK